VREIYESEVTTTIKVLDNSYLVRFKRLWAYSALTKDTELIEDYYENVEVLIGDTRWTKLDSINRWTRTDIERALDKWLLGHYPDEPDRSGEHGYFRYGLENGK
jgi:hypothetical protein